MFGRPRNRRRPTERALKAPATNWRAVGLTLGTVAGVAALASAVSWAYDQPIETVAVTGRFQRVAPVDVERAVKGTLHGVGLLSVDLAAVRRAIHKFPWVEAVSGERFWPRGLDVLVVEQGAAARRGEPGTLKTSDGYCDPEQ